MTSKLSPSMYAQATLFLDGKPFRLTDQPYMEQVYNTEPREMLLMMARQVGKTISLGAKMVVKATGTPHYRILYVSPTYNQVSQFSNDKLRPFITQSPMIKKYFLNKESTTNVMEKSFSNQSKVILRSCFNSADSIRGITADYLALDEVQDIGYDNIFVIKEIGSSRLNFTTLYAGTPKTINNTLGRLWKKSTQNEWAIKCTGCNHYNIIGLAHIGKEGLVCEKCNKRLNYMHGTWVQTNPNPNPINSFPAYRIPQPCTPFHQHPSKWKELLKKLEEGNLALFYNEVLAQPYSQAENPVTEEEVRACCNPEYTIFPEPEDHMKGSLSHIPLYAGLDYGRTTSYTVFTVVGRVGNKSRLFYARKFVGRESDPNVYMPIVVDLVNRFRCVTIGADSGDGNMQNKYLQNHLGRGRVMVFNAADNLGQLIRFKPEAASYVFNRTGNLQNRFMQIKSKLIEFPCWPRFQPYASMILCVFIDYSEATEKMYYDHDGENEPDDFLHSWNYSEMACHIHNGGLIPSELMGHGDYF